MKLSAILAPLVAAKVPHEVILEAVRAYEQEQENALERRRRADADRQARKREREKSRYVTLRHSDRSLVRGRDTRVEDKTSNSEIEPQKKEGDALTREALEAYETMASKAGLAVPRVVTAARRTRLQAVIRQHGMDTFREALAKVGASSFCRGSNDRGWKADLDFVLKPSSFAKILEGHYDDRPNARAGPAPPHVPQLADVFKLASRQVANGQEREDSGGIRPAVSYLPAVRSG